MPDKFYQWAVLKNVAKFSEKHLRSNFLIIKKTLAKVLSCEFCEILKNIFFLQNTSGGCFCESNAWLHHMPCELCKSFHDFFTEEFPSSVCAVMKDADKFCFQGAVCLGKNVYSWCEIDLNTKTRSHEQLVIVKNKNQILKQSFVYTMYFVKLYQ